MHVAIRRSGGFANVGARAEVDTSTMPAEKARELARLVAALPPQPPARLHAAHAADVYQYDITVDGRTYRADDLSMPESWRALVDFVLDS